MRQLKEFSIPAEKSYLDRVRDVFRFCCVTGLRYSDAFNLRRADIKEDYIEVTTQKTTDSLRIPLNTPASAILEKYKNVPFENGKALPVISNQKMNDYLRELCQLAGIDAPVRITTIRGNVRTDEIIPKYKLIGTHAARRTFVTTMLSKGISAEVVMKITGHSSYSAMKPYIEIVSSARANAMQVLNEI